MKASISAATLSKLIESIYDCAVEPEHWPGTLTHMCATLNFAGAIMSLLALPSSDVLIDVSTGVDPIWLERAPLYNADLVELWGGPQELQSYPLDEPLVLSRVKERPELENNRFFQQWLRPQGIHDTLAIWLARDTTMAGTLGFSRHDSAGVIGDIEIEAARLLIPHLRRAVTIGRLLDMKSIAAATFEASLDTLTAAVFLIDADLRILHANTAALALISPGNSMSSQGGILTVQPPGVGMALTAAVRQAADNEAAIGRRGFGIPLRRPDGTPLVLHVLPLTHGALRPGLAPSAAAAVFVAPAASPPLAPKEALAALFDLTPSEARVFELIAGGMTQSEAARELGVESGTVKTHLLKVFAKTGTHRQSELIRLTASLALPVRT